MVRDIDLDEGCVLRIAEDNSLRNEAGATLWDAALVLVNYLSLLQQKSQGAWLQGKRVIDVGCGTGVAGLSAAALGAAGVVLTDLPHLVPLAERNIQLNNLQGVASASALQWGQPVGHLRPPFDLVLASDVIYNRSLIQPLLATLRELSGPSTLILLAAEHREKLPFPQGAFAASGFAVQRVPHCELHPHWSSDDISVYQLSLAAEPTPEAT